MVVFCEKCDGLMRPSKEGTIKFIICKFCGTKVPIKEKLKKSYISKKKIKHPLGEEFKNSEEMEDWKEQEIYKKFKDYT